MGYMQFRLAEDPCEPAVYDFDLGKNIALKKNQMILFDDIYLLTSSSWVLEVAKSCPKEQKIFCFNFSKRFFDVLHRRAKDANQFVGQPQTFEDKAPRIKEDLKKILSYCDTVFIREQQVNFYNSTFIL